MCMKKRNIICQKCLMAYLSCGMYGEDIVICSKEIGKCDWQIGYIDWNSYVVKLCGRDDLRLTDFI